MASKNDKLKAQALDMGLVIEGLTTAQISEAVELKLAAQEKPTGDDASPVTDPPQIVDSPVVDSPVVVGPDNTLTAENPEVTATPEIVPSSEGDDNTLPPEPDVVAEAKGAKGSWIIAGGVLTIMAITDDGGTTRQDISVGSNTEAFLLFGV